MAVRRGAGPGSPGTGPATSAPPTIDHLSPGGGDVEAARRGGWRAGGDVAARWAYALFCLTLIIVYPFLSDHGRLAAFRVVAFAAIPAVLIGARRGGVRRGHVPWWVPLLLAGLIIINVANQVRLIHGVFAEASSGAIDAAGNVVILAAAVALAVRCGRTDFGGVIDTAIVAIAVGGLIWDF